MRKIVLIAIVLLVCGASFYYWNFYNQSFQGNRLSNHAIRILNSAEHFELLSLEPHANAKTPTTAFERFQNYRVLGKLEFKDSANRSELVNALAKSIEKMKGDEPALACFNPRHGIHATLGTETVDLVICFECEQVEIHHGSIHRYVRTTSGAASIFNAPLKAANIPLDED